MTAPHRQEKEALLVFTTTALTVPAPDRPAGSRNEDTFAAGDGWWVVLDGATAPPNRPSGCQHDVRWVVDTLGAWLAYELAAGAAKPLAEVLRAGIQHLRAAHADTCDLTNPDSPSTTVAIVRQHVTGVEAITLADSPILVKTANDVHVVQDDRTAHLTDRSYDGVAAARNTPGGFWVASTVPDAADYAVTGEFDDVEGFALLTDGASRWYETLGLGSAAELYAELRTNGPAAIIEQVRVAEKDPTRQVGRKIHDDATVVWAHA